MEACKSMLMMQASSPRAGTEVVASARELPGRNLLSSCAWNQLCVSMRLSARELQILQCVFDDQKAVNIAFELGLSPHTVNTYFARLYKKLDVYSRPQLILRALAEYFSPRAPGMSPENNKIN
jgi:DNA-binding NarL/FixJ family response regulator